MVDNKMQAPPVPKTTPKVLTLSDFPADAVAHLRDVLHLSDADIDEVIQGINDGFKSPGEYLGLTEGNANYLEDMAVGLYRSRHYQDALCLFLTLTDLFPKRASAWRGAAACLQAGKVYPAAVMLFLQASTLAPDDIITAVLLGECFCLLERPHVGVNYMEKALSLPARTPLEKSYHQRATAVIRANGQIERPTDDPGQTPQNVPDPMDQRLRDRLKLVAHIEGSEEAVRILETPEMRQVVDRLMDAVQCEIITVREVAGFTDEQMRGAYIAACSYLEQGQAMQAMQLCGWLIYLDARSPEYYQLAGVAAHHLKLYCLADYFYGISLIYGPDNPATLIYRGEAKILSEERHAGVALLKRGTALCGNNAELQEMNKRGRFLLQQFDGAARSQAHK